MDQHFLIAILSLFLELKKVEKHNFVDFLVSVDETCYKSILRLWWDKLTPSRWIRVTPRKNLFRMCEDFPCFSLWFDFVSYVISNLFPNNDYHVIVTMLLFLLAWFSLGIVNSWYMPHEFWDTLWCYCFALEVILLAQHRKAFHLLKFEQRYPSLVLRLLEFSTTFLVDPWHLSFYFTIFQNHFLDFVH